MCMYVYINLHTYIYMHARIYDHLRWYYTMEYIYACVYTTHIRSYKIYYTMVNVGYCFENFIDLSNILICNSYCNIRCINLNLTRTLLTITISVNY